MCKHGCLMVNCSYNYKLLDKCLMVNSSYQKHSHGCHELTRNPYKKIIFFYKNFQCVNSNMKKLNQKICQKILIKGLFFYLTNDLVKGSDRQCLVVELR